MAKKTSTKDLKKSLKKAKAKVAKFKKAEAKVKKLKKALKNA